MFPSISIHTSATNAAYSAADNLIFSILETLSQITGLAGHWRQGGSLGTGTTSYEVSSGHMFTDHLALCARGTSITTPSTDHNLIIIKPDQHVSVA